MLPSGTPAPNAKFGDADGSKGDPLGVLDESLGLGASEEEVERSAGGR